MMRLLQGAWVIARRDFAATVLSKAFIFFLLAPLFPLLMGGLFGTIGARVATDTDRAVVAVVASPAEFAQLSAARERLAAATDNSKIVQLQFVDARNPHSKDAAGAGHGRVDNVLTLDHGNAQLVGAAPPEGSIAKQLRLILAAAEASSPHLIVKQVQPDSAASSKDRALTAQIGQMLLFFLTLLLAGMLMSQLIEEKSNKIIEVIAAAVPIDSMFVGKLFAMLAASILGMVVWVGAGALLIQLVKHGGVASLPPPAVGWPAFMLLAILYFAMNYLLFGAVFLMIGAQASTAREVQIMSMPATFAQVIIFAFASAVIGHPNSPEALAAAVFPLSSPLTMLARAAEQPELWPHLLAIAWQALWVGIILHLGSRLFRKTVLKSGPRGRSWFRRASAA